MRWMGWWGMHAHVFLQPCYRTQTSVLGVRVILARTRGTCVTGSTDFADAPVRVEAFGWEDSAASSSNTGATSSTTNTNSAASGTPSGSAAGPANPSRSTINSTAAVAGSTSSTGGGGTSLGGSPVVALAAAKFHSAAVTADGRLWTWGWGRGGRLGDCV